MQFGAMHALRAGSLTTAGCVGFAEETGGCASRFAGWNADILDPIVSEQSSCLQPERCNVERGTACKHSPKTLIWGSP